ncbi:aldo/keto reductase [Phytoactinopolyspora alkaliphila]|uniref:Aldo/keto reductase n=1 Tax=Phytoactinopolyspora alkaliphila TaxID=1783498 RepID=A0A6N9YTN9_9ACTN|nr:aldo/keto reductase [Phytoactinopolyspora alkaliphila]NED98179.1 aldo/keto reductase [Phytoactinopolyspora alkaliphila]
MTPLHRTGRTPALTELSFGAAPLGNLYEEVSDDDAASAVEAAWQAGVRFFDTAPHYGLGLSERRLGAALAAHPRDEYVLSTKVGRRLEPRSDGAGQRDASFVVPATHRRIWDFSRDGILRTLEDSLRRLGTDRIDIVFLHDPDDYWPQAAGEGYATLADLRAQGVVRAIGAGMNQSAMLTRFVRETDVDVVLVAGRYTLLEQGALDDLLPAALERGVTVVAAAVFNSGLLALDRPCPDAKYNYADAPAALVERAHRIADVCESHGVTLPAAALRYPLLHPAVRSVTVGMRTPRQVERNAGLLAQDIPEALWQDLSRAGLIRAGASVSRDESI